MEFNINGKIDEYYNLDDILRLNLDNKTKDNFREKFGKTVYFDLNGSCRIGKLCGLENNYQLSMVYYIIINGDGDRMLIPTYKSITTL